MADAMQNIIPQFKQAMQKLYGDRLSRVILFGSYARGEAREQSDIDFMIVLKDEHISEFKEIENINKHIYNLILQTGKIISFIPVTEKKFMQAPNYFYRLVKEEGKVL